MSTVVSYHYCKKTRHKVRDYKQKLAIEFEMEKSEKFNSY